MANPKGLGGFRKGQSGNPLGRPERAEIEVFRDVMSQLEQKRGKSILYHAVEQAYEDNMVLVALLRKILPDKIEGVKEKRERLVLIRPAGAKEVPGLTD